MNLELLKSSASVYFFLRHKDGRFAVRTMYMVPRVGDLCVFNEVRYRVEVVGWCLDTDATEIGVPRVNIELVGQLEAAASSTNQGHSPKRRA